MDKQNLKKASKDFISKMIVAYAVCAFACIIRAAQWDIFMRIPVHLCIIILSVIIVIDEVYLRKA